MPKHIVFKERKEQHQKDLIYSFSNFMVKRDGDSNRSRESSKASYRSLDKFIEPSHKPMTVSAMRAKRVRISEQQPSLMESSQFRSVSRDQAIL